MSFIIGISKTKYFYHFNKPAPHHSKSQPSIHSGVSQKSNSLALSIQEALKLQQIHFYTRNAPYPHTFIITEQFELGKSVGGVISFRVGAVEGTVNIKVDILSNRHQYFRLQSLDQRIFINRLISASKNGPNNQFFKASICMSKGIIKLTLPLHYLLQVSSMENSSALRKTAILRKFIDIILFQTKSFLDFVLKKDNGRISGLSNANMQLFRLRQMMNLFKRGYEGNEVMSEKSIRQYKTKQSKSIKDLIRNKIQNLDFFTSLKHYILRYQDDCEFNSQGQCAFNSYEMDLVKRLSIPSRKVNTYESNHSYTMTHILLNKPNQIKLNPINTGGFSSIFLAEVHYTFADLSRGNEHIKDKTLQKGLMIIKKEINTPKQLSRNVREKSIIQKMKNSTSFMLNRYYFPLNLPQKSRSDIFMDYIPYPTLKEFMQLNRHSISLQSKLTILLSVLQGIRSIEQFDVVHLDLKPNNIMMNSQLQIKLLDFGESYHPQVQKCKPGFTMPYACPQIHSSCSQFTSKSDVYSLGVLIFEMLYKKHPFYFHSDVNLHKYKTDSYLQHWLWVPEDSNKMGQMNIYQTLNLMISRCLQKEVSRRPELLCIGLILQECINMLQ